MGISFQLSTDENEMCINKLLNVFHDLGKRIRNKIHSTKIDMWLKLQRKHNRDMGLLVPGASFAIKAREKENETKASDLYVDVLV
jgi:hypothetical protein